jgi:uncharacterized protein (TIGR03066 family)
MKSKEKQRTQTHAQASREPYLTLEGTIHEGAVVLENGTSIPDGTRVRVIVSESAVPPTTFQSLLKIAKTQPPARKIIETGTWKRRLLLGLLALLTAGSVWAFFEFIVWSNIPSELVGKWVVLEGPQEGATFDFFRGGTMKGKVNIGGREGIVNGRVRMDGKNLLWTTRHSQTGAEDSRSKIIRTLTAKELVLEDEQGGLLKMERAE